MAYSDLVLRERPGKCWARRPYYYFGLAESGEMLGETPVLLLLGAGKLHPHGWRAKAIGEEPEDQHGNHKRQQQQPRKRTSTPYLSSSGHSLKNTA